MSYAAGQSLPQQYVLSTSQLPLGLTLGSSGVGGFVGSPVDQTLPPDIVAAAEAAVRTMLAGRGSPGRGMARPLASSPLSSPLGSP